MTADEEFYKELLKIHLSMTERGWIRREGKISKNIVDAHYTKNGLGIYILFGCDEDVKKEI